MPQASIKFTKNIFQMKIDKIIQFRHVDLGVTLERNAALIYFWLLYYFYYDIIKMNLQNKL